MLYSISTTYPEDMSYITLLSVSYLLIIFRKGYLFMGGQINTGIDAANRIGEMTVAGVLALGLISLLILFYFYRKDAQSREMRLREDKDRLHNEHQLEMKSLCAEYSQLAERCVSATLDSTAALDALTDALKLIFQEKINVNLPKRRTERDRDR